MPHIVLNKSLNLFDFAIRLLPLTDPEKTDLVKQSLANLCLEIQKHYPDMEIIKSNLWDYLTKDIVS